MNLAKLQRLARLTEQKYAALEALTQSLRHQACTGGFDRLSHRQTLPSL
jgi:hypothetical protein